MAELAEAYSGLHQPPSLIIVHAQPTTAETLRHLLAGYGYDVCLSDQPDRLIESLKQRTIHLVLLDEALTEVDSNALCQQLKHDPETRDIPIIIVGQGEYQWVAQAFDAGANDYISEPFQGAIVHARVRNQLDAYARRLQLSSQNALLLAEVRERQQVEKALRQAESKYRSIFENATEGIFQTSKAGRYLSVNPALAQIYGYDSPEELMNTVTDVGQQIYVQPKRRDELIVYLQKFGQIVGAESEVFRKDGSRIWVSETIREICDDKGAFLYYEGIVHDITERRQMEMELRQQRQKADRLLINILPYQIAHRLKSGVRTIAESLDEVSVMFADLVEFTNAAGQMSPREIVELLNNIFSTFDKLATQYQLEKIKTIGDEYMAAGGLLTNHGDHVEAMGLMALEMQRTIQSFQRPDNLPFQLRIGIHVGPVVAGVIGMRKFAYDLWGDTVNIASRMESTGEPGRIQVTPEVYQRLRKRFYLKPRGAIAVKGRGLMETYWLIGQRKAPNDSSRP